jgi:hypothetical protein
MRSACAGQQSRLHDLDAQQYDALYKLCTACSLPPIIVSQYVRPRQMKIRRDFLCTGLGLMALK